MTDQDAVVDTDNVKTFCQTFDSYALFQHLQSFQAGSAVELKHDEGSMKKFGLNVDKEDLDTMFFAIDEYVFPLDRLVPEKHRGDVFRIRTDGMHPGYARLIEERSGKALTPILLNNFNPLKLPPDDRNGEKHGPAWKFKVSQIATNLMNNSDQNEVGLPTFGHIMKDVKLLGDAVLAVHSPYWPVEASEWITRTRRHGCPSKSVVKQVVQYGCDFVFISHKRSLHSDTHEWRFSFSKAEFLIIRGWTSLQRIAYRVVRLMYKLTEQKMHGRHEATVLCTYYFKTLMLWATEERPQEFWAEHLLVHSIKDLLIEMCNWLKMKHCCNYFIPDNNMMDHLAGSDVSRDVAALLKACEDDQLIRLAVSRCSLDERMVLDYDSSPFRVTFTADIPCWIHSTILILVTRILLAPQNLISSENDKTHLQSALLEQLTHVYFGLASQAKAAACSSGADRVEFMFKAEQRYNIAATLYQSTTKQRVEIGRLIGFIAVFFILNNSNDAHLKSLRPDMPTERDSVGNREKCSEDDDLLAIATWYTIQNSADKVKQSTIANANMPTTCGKDLYFMFPGVSPTVHASLFS